VNWSARQWQQATKWITRDDGTTYTANELKAAFLDELAEGHEVLPIGSPCEGFDYKSGCPGHPVEA